MIRLPRLDGPPASPEPTFQLLQMSDLRGAETSLDNGDSMDVDEPAWADQPEPSKQRVPSCDVRGFRYFEAGVQSQLRMSSVPDS